MNPPPTSRTPKPFSLDWVDAFLPHYAKQGYSALHRELAADLAGMTTHRGSTLNRIAPRGFAKSTLVSKAYPLYGICERTEAFVLILSDSSRQAKSFIRSIKRELTANPALAQEYPAACGVGPIWQTDHIRTRNGVEVMVAGGGGSVRGLSADESRPTLVVVDDANKKEDAYSHDQRAKKMEWLQMDILPIGEPGTNFVSIGTPIHREAIVCALAAEGWDTKSYRSLTAWPDRMDLWHEWERVATFLADDRRKETAANFYAANRTAMDAGASLLWPERFPLVYLMTKRSQMGDAAFRSEYQDEPGTAGATEWPSDYFDGPEFWVQSLPESRRFTVQSLDPSKGVADRPGDYQAHVVVAVDTDGNLVFDADLRREDATRMVDRAAENAALWHPNEIVVETNATMGLLWAEFERVKAAGGFGGAAILEQTSHDHKSVRIREVGGYLARRQVRVVNGAGGRELVRQWRDWPNGDYDDAADAAGVAVRRAAMVLSR